MIECSDAMEKKNWGKDAVNLYFVWGETNQSRTKMPLCGCSGSKAKNILR
jgi:hypothetical protein